MDTASGVHIGQVGWAESRFVCMSGDKGDTRRLGKTGQPFFDPILVTVIFGSTGRVKHAEALQRAPEIADKKAVQLPSGGVPEVSLMTVGQVELMTFTAPEDQSFVERKTGEQLLTALCVRTEIGATDPVGISGLLFLKIVISIEQIESALTVKKRK